MPRSSSVLTAALTLALAAVPFTTARAAKPQPPPPPPQLVAVVWANLAAGSCTNYIAVADDGRVLVAQCYAPGFAVAATLPGVPVSAYYAGGGTTEFSVGLANGDIYRLSDTRASLPWTFTYMGNAFAAIAGVRLPDFAAPAVAPSVTEDPAPTEDDVSDAVRPGAEK